jgi:alcohol dehydrogenase class IV
MISFELAATSRVVFRPGAIADLPALLREQAVSKVMIVTDHELVRLGLVQPALDAIRSSAGLEAILCADVEADPPEHIIYSAAELGRRDGIDAVVGLGGGSVMDTAKLVAYLVSNPCTLESIYGVGLATGRRLPLILVPTIAGTGFEVTPISIVTTSSHEKRGVVSPRLVPDVALLDPQLTLGLP